MHEPGDFESGGGVADVAAAGGGGVGAEGVDEGVAGGVEHKNVGVAGGIATEGGAEGDGAGGVVVFGVGGLFAHVEGFDDEDFVDDGSVGGVLEEVIEHMARAAPGGAENEEDILVLGGGGGAGLGKDFCGAGLGVGERWEEECGGDEGGAEGVAHGGRELRAEVWGYIIMRWTDGLWRGRGDLCDRLTPCLKLLAGCAPSGRLLCR